MKTAKPKAATSTPRSFLFAPLLLAVILALLFWKSFLPGYVHFSNDGPLAQQNAAYIQLPGSLTGCWGDLNGIGGNAGGASLNVTTGIRWIFDSIGNGAVLYAKFFQPIAMFILGLAAWTFFRQLKLSPLAAALGGLAAGLQTAWFSNACWGVAGQQIAIAMAYFSLALVVSNTPETPPLVRWLRWVLAGLAVGLNVMEGADNGAIYSLFIAAFVVVKAMVEESSPMWLRAGHGVLRVAVIAVFAGLIAFQTIVTLVGFAGIGGGGQAAQAKAGNWDFATEWSLPKAETLSLFVPGLFGYRMDTPNEAAGFLQNSYLGGLYWGGIGRAPARDRFFDQVFQPGDEITVGISTPENQNQSVNLKVGSDGYIAPPYLEPIKAAGRTGLQLKEAIEQTYASRQIPSSVELPQGFMRQSGGGNYQGIVLAVIAFWAIAQSFRRRDSVFTDSQRKFIWFWAAVSLLALMLAWGRFAPFYQFFYALPYSSAMRNPTKFVSIFSWSFLIIFGYGVHGLSRRYLQAPASNIKSSIAQLQSWWRNARGFDRKWTIGCGAVFAVCVLAWLFYASEKPALIRYLEAVDFSDPNYAGDIAAFSIGQVGWFLIYLAAVMLLCVLIMAGVFSGPRARLGGILLGVLLLADYVRADLPYMVFWNYPVKYQSNPIVDFLRDKPYEHRVIELPYPRGQMTGPDAQYDEHFDGDYGLYRIEWIQQLFPYYNIQSLDYVQNPRMASDLMAFYEALSPDGTPESGYLIARNWELSNNRYFLGPMTVQGNIPTMSALNGYLDPMQKRFRIVQRFDIIPKPEVRQGQYLNLDKLTAVTDDNGGCALFEFTGALPRVKLYSNWETNSPAELAKFTTNNLSGRDLAIFNSVGANDFLTLKKLAAPSFDPWQTVLFSDPVPAPAAGTNSNEGTVDFKSYSPKKIILATQASGPTMLLLNDKYDPHWRVWVDGKPAELLRANFIMRGVYLPAGAHTVMFYFALPSRPLYVTASAIVLGIILSGCLIFVTRRKPQS